MAAAWRATATAVLAAAMLASSRVVVHRDAHRGACLAVGERGRVCVEVDAVPGLERSTAVLSECNAPVLLQVSVAAWGVPHGDRARSALAVEDDAVAAWWGFASVADAERVAVSTPASPDNHLVLCIRENLDDSACARLTPNDMAWFDSVPLRPRNERAWMLAASLAALARARQSRTSARVWIGIVSLCMESPGQSLAATVPFVFLRALRPGSPSIARVRLRPLHDLSRRWLQDQQEHRHQEEAVVSPLGWHRAASARHHWVIPLDPAEMGLSNNEAALASDLITGDILAASLRRATVDADVKVMCRVLLDDVQYALPGIVPCRHLIDLAAGPRNVSMWTSVDSRLADPLARLVDGSDEDASAPLLALESAISHLSRRGTIAPCGSDYTVLVAVPLIVQQPTPILQWHFESVSNAACDTFSPWMVVLVSRHPARLQDWTSLFDQVVGGRHMHPEQRLIIGIPSPQFPPLMLSLDVRKSLRLAALATPPSRRVQDMAPREDDPLLLAVHARLELDWHAHGNAVQGLWVDPQVIGSAARRLLMNELHASPCAVRIAADASRIHPADRVLFERSVGCRDSESGHLRWGVPSLAQHMWPRALQNELPVLRDRGTGDRLSYAELAAVDRWLCVTAPAFLGHRGSTFSARIAIDRALTGRHQSWCYGSQALKSMSDIRRMVDEGECVSVNEEP